MEPMSVSEQLAVIRRAVGERPVAVAAATKYASIAQMREAYAAGIRIFAENRVQEALLKMAAFPADVYPDLRWHLIGPLQTNKISKTLGRFELIHSVDSVRVAQELSRRNAEATLLQPVLLQVNVSGELSKHGFALAEVRTVVETVKTLPGIALQGLMTMAPHISDPSLLKTVFCDLKSLRDALEETYAISLPDLSMGMSNDFMHAIECGATIVRIGSHLFHTTNESA